MSAGTLRLREGGVTRPGIHSSPLDTIASESNMPSVQVSLFVQAGGVGGRGKGSVMSK
jgi:hypothetical protein